MKPKITQRPTVPSLAPAARRLFEFQGDFFVSILFLPVALMFQQVCQRILICNQEYCVVMLPALKLGILLFTCILQTVAIGLVFVGFRDFRTFNLLIVPSVLIFMITITVMGQVYGKEFRVAFSLSLIAAFWGLLLLDDWSHLKLKIPLLNRYIPSKVTHILLITSFLVLFLFVPISYYIERLPAWINPTLFILFAVLWISVLQDLEDTLSLPRQSLIPVLVCFTISAVWYLLQFPPEIPMKSQSTPLAIFIFGG